MCFVCLLKHWYKEQTMQIKWGKHFSELFHVSNGVRQGGVLSSYLFAVYSDDLSNELNNIKAGCYIGKVLLNHLMFADDVCVLCPSVRWLQRILGVCQAYVESHGIIFNCNKTVCMTFKDKSAKSTATPLLKLGGQYVKSVDQYKYLRIVLDTELSNDKVTKTFRDNCDINSVANKLQASFSRCSNHYQIQLKRTFTFLLYAHVCMHLNYGVISGSHACRDCVWHIILDAELYTTCPGEQVLVATRFNVTFLLEALLRKYTYLFLERCRKSNNLWLRALIQSAIVCTRHYSLNTIIAFYSVNEWWNFAVSIWSMACQATMLSHFT